MYFLKKSKLKLQHGVKRIAIFEPYIFDRPYGNLHYIAGLFKYHDRERFELVLIAPRESEFFRTIESLGGRCICVTAPALLLSFGGKLLKGKIAAKFTTLVSLVRYNLAIARELKRERVDVFQCNSIRAVLMAGCGAWIAGCPLVWYVKGELANPLLDRIGFHLAKRIVFQSASYLRLCYPHPSQRKREKLSVVSNGIDLGEIVRLSDEGHRQLGKELGLRPGWVNFVYLGQISPLKGLNYLLDSMAIVQSRERVALYLVGDHCAEEYRDYLQALKTAVAKHELQEIHFLGWRPDRLAIVSLMDGLILPSLSEGAPRSVLEAAALAKPVIATRLGSTPEMVEDGASGFLVEPRDSAAMAERILKLALDRALRERMGQRGCQIVHSRYSISRNVASLQRLYTCVVDRRESPLGDSSFTSDEEA